MKQPHEMLSSNQALALILNEPQTLPTESVPVDSVAGRIAAENIAAKLTQPPFNASAMDGYAGRFADMQTGARLPVITEIRAGDPSPLHKLNPGETIRVFTGSPIPEGADHVLMQEHASVSNSSITVEVEQLCARNVRARGIDFCKGDILVQNGTIMHEIHASLLAAANLTQIPVRRKPRLSLFSCGDELVEPGTEPDEGHIINSNHYSLSGLARRWGATTRYAGCAPDQLAKITAMFQDCQTESDIILVTGGASVGKYDYVKQAFANAGGDLLFQNIAIKPGKPTWFGSLNNICVLGLPGNPASAIVSSMLFLRPLLYKLAGRTLPQEEKAALLSPLPANAGRETFLRARLENTQAIPCKNQDSSLLSPFANANILIRRPANTPETPAGAKIPVIRI